jgi:erythromycin esterase-like protein
VRTDLSQQLRERAIGVIYPPESELASHYFSAALAQQFDAWIWFEESAAVDAVPAEPAGEPPETFPFGV